MRDMNTQAQVIKHPLEFRLLDFVEGLVTGCDPLSQQPLKNLWVELAILSAHVSEPVQTTTCMYSLTIDC